MITLVFGGTALVTVYEKSPLKTSQVDRGDLDIFAASCGARSPVQEVKAMPAVLGEERWEDSAAAHFPD
jgi:hypothetical protein